MCQWLPSVMASMASAGLSRHQPEAGSRWHIFLTTIGIFRIKSATRSLRRVSACSYSLTSIKVAKGLVRFCCRFLYGHSVRTVRLILQSSRTVGPLCGGGNLEELYQAGCISIYKDPADLIRHYDSSPPNRATA